MAYQKYQREGVRVKKHNVKPEEIAEDFMIHELIKMFPEAEESFYDKIRYHLRQYKYHFSDDRFWRMVAGISDTYMLKGYYRMLRGTQYRWVLADVNLDQLKVGAAGELAKIMKKVNYNVIEAGKLLRSMPPKKRSTLLDPFDFKRDSSPIFVIDDGKELELHDGNRRTINAAVFEMTSLPAYIGYKIADGKPALREDVLADIIKTMELVERVDSNLMNSIFKLLVIYKRKYVNGPQLVDTYIKDHVIRFLEELDKVEGRQKLISRAREVIAMDVNAENVSNLKIEQITNSNGHLKKNKLFAQGFQPS